MGKENKVKGIITLIILAVVALIMFSGKVSYTLEEGTLEVGSFMSGKSKVALQDIKELELRDGMTVGERTFGVSNLKVLGGTFTNEEFGKYKLYIYKDVSNIIVVHTDEGIMGFNLETEEDTETLYKELQEKIE